MEVEDICLELLKAAALLPPMTAAAATTATPAAIATCGGESIATGVNLPPREQTRWRGCEPIATGDSPRPQIRVRCFFLGR
eukprot:6175742-Pyramimonas_sp.AAC.2